MAAALALACAALAPGELARAEGAGEDEVVRVWVINVVVQSDGIPVAAYKYTYTDHAHCEIGAKMIGVRLSFGVPPVCAPEWARRSELQAEEPGPAPEERGV